jgi:uncharacterized membrane protein
MSFLYCLAGVNHFLSPAAYKNIMPLWLPYHYPLIYLSGAIEVVLAILLLVGATRRLAAWGLIILLLAVFPANIQMMFNYWQVDDARLWVAILRLPLQPLLIYWAYLFTKTDSLTVPVG